MIHRLLLSACLLPGCVGLDSVPGDDEGASRLAPSPGRPPASGGGDDTASDRETGEDSGEPGGDDTGEQPGGDSGDDSGTPASDNPLAGLRLWVDPDSNAANEAAGASGAEAEHFRKIADNAVAKWLGGWSGDVEATVRDAADQAEADGAVRTFVVYNLPNRDCGGYSAGGAADRAEYEGWIDSIAAGLAGRAAIVVLEPDGLSMMDCLSSSEADDRYAMIRYAVSTLQGAGAFVYIDAGHSAWHPTATMAERLNASDIGSAAGFALNSSNFETTSDIVAYGTEISGMTGGARFVADTARNGLGPTSDHEWCNPDGRALGEPSTLTPDYPLVDGLLWIKAPGESDGSCNGGPSAGTWWPEYALGLAERAAW